jgi:hypothetical protein
MPGRFLPDWELSFFVRIKWRFIFRSQSFLTSLTHSSRGYVIFCARKNVPACNQLEEINVKKVLIALAVAIALAGGVRANDDREDKKDSDRFEFKAGTLVLSRSVYAGTAATVTVGQTLPPGCVAKTVTLPVLNSNTTTSVKVTCSTATADGTFPTVFNNNKADGSFGVTSPIFLDNITADGWLLGTLPIPSDQIVTSFSSKSE